MLRITRKVTDSVLIGDDIEVIILGNHDGVIEMGIRAPQSVLILRKELLGRGKEKPAQSVICRNCGGAKCDSCSLPGTY